MQPADPPAQPARVFVVDDDPAMRTLIGRILTMEHFEPIPFDTPLLALHALQAGVPVDLMVTGVEMGDDMTGLDLAREARVARPELPIVIVTGIRGALPSDDVNAIVRKPFRMADLTATVRECLAGDGV